MVDVVVVQPLLQLCVCVPLLQALVVQLLAPGTQGVGPGSGGPLPPSVQAWLWVLLVQPSEHVRVCVPALQLLQAPHELIPRTQALMLTSAARLTRKGTSNVAATTASMLATTNVEMCRDLGIEDMENYLARRR